MFFPGGLRFGVAAAVLLLLLTVPANRGFADEYDRLVGSGDAAYSKFDNKAALEVYTKAYELDPERYDALFRLTRANIDVGEDLDNTESATYYAEAMTLSEKMVAKHPNDLQANYLSAVARGRMALTKSGKERVRLGQGIEKFAKKAIEIDPNYPRSYTSLAMYYRNIANLNWFLKAFASALYGGLPDVSNKDAALLFEKAIELDPAGIYPRYELAVTYEMMGEKQKALDTAGQIASMPETDHNDHKTKQRAAELIKSLGGK